MSHTEQHLEMVEQQEPYAYAYMGVKHDGALHGPHLVWKPEYMDAMSASMGAEAIPLYLNPPKREWQGLTDEEIDTWNIVGHESLREFVRAIEAKLKEKNT